MLADPEIGSKEPTSLPLPLWECTRTLVRDVWGRNGRKPTLGNQSGCEQVLESSLRSHAGRGNLTCHQRKEGYKPQAGATSFSLPVTFSFPGRNKASCICLFSYTNKVAQNVWLKQQKLLFSQFWQLEVQYQSISRIGCFWGPSLIYRWLSSPWAFTWSSLCIFWCLNLLFLQGHQPYWVRVHPVNLILASFVL